MKLNKDKNLIDIQTCNELDLKKDEKSLEFHMKLELKARAEAETELVNALGLVLPKISKR